MTATATVPQVLTPAEVRAAIAREWGTRPPVGPSIEVDFSDGLTRCTGLLDGLFDRNDFRESEKDRLNELTDQAVGPIGDEARRQINEALVSAGLTFAAEHPDAPRATRDRVTA